MRRTGKRERLGWIEKEVTIRQPDDDSFDLFWLFWPLWRGKHVNTPPVSHTTHVPFHQHHGGMGNLREQDVEFHLVWDEKTSQNISFMQPVTVFN